MKTKTKKEMIVEILNMNMMHCVNHEMQKRYTEKRRVKNPEDLNCEKSVLEGLKALEVDLECREILVEMLKEEENPKTRKEDKRNKRFNS